MLYFPNNVEFLSVNIIFILANSADLVKCHVLWHFIWVFTVCKSARFRASGLRNGWEGSGVKYKTIRYLLHLVILQINK